ncbi:nickel pincer cofactor biosynthesis protein LarB [Rubripirellula reticaptiva]|uniref:AIR carboxylase n=1 Tax=Rubripirellula reticaptiva TaxID=2528013 RepID=A0A5C6F6K2_9BACT|nr:AIR carboxylase [Rubripirellula reticaptiva]
MPEQNGIPSALLCLLSEVIAGRATATDLVHQIGLLAVPETATDAADGTSMTEIDGATVDLGRKARCGFGEVIYGPGKSADLVARLIETQLEAGQDSLVTRIDPQTAVAATHRFTHARHNPVARTLRVSSAPIVSGLQPSPNGLHVAVVTAGSTDAPVAEEAIETIEWMGVPVSRFDDIGVAGPQRLIAAVPKLREASAVVVVAGMEGALPSVVAGHLAVPIFAVPTSVGYGASLGGLTPLLGMLSACAANVAVVNIDAGFKGGYLAGMVVSQLRQVTPDTCQAS